MVLWQGMGEGEGAKDVSDQITDEDQLLGAKQKDQPQDAPKVLLADPHRVSNTTRSVTAKAPLQAGAVLTILGCS